MLHRLRALFSMKCADNLLYLIIENRKLEIELIVKFIIVDFQGGFYGIEVLLL